MADEQVYEPEPIDEGGTITSSALESITRGEIDIQVSTAKRFPRNLAKFKANAITAVTSSQEIAESCNYYLERKEKDGTKKAIEGPSIRLAEICMNFFGNTRWAGRVIGEDDKYIYAQGVVHDVENNNFVSEEVPRKITGRSGQRFSADMVAVTGAAAKSIAMRNAALRVIPRSYIEEIRVKAKERAQGNATNVLERWGKAVIFFKNFGVTEAQLLAKLGRDAVEKLTPDDIGKLIGLRTALKEGMTTIAEQFPAPTEPEKADGEQKLEDAPKPAAVDPATDKVADDLTKGAKKEPTKRAAKKETKEPAPATSSAPAVDRGELLRTVHDKLTTIFAGDAKVIDAAIAEASKGTYPDWSTFATKGSVVQVQSVLDSITQFEATAPEAATSTAAAEQQPLVKEPPAGNWIAHVTKTLPANEERTTLVLRILKGAEILDLDEKRIVKELADVIGMPVTSPNVLNAVDADTLKKVHKRLVDIGNAT